MLILDDVFAELDAGRRERLAALVATAEQVLVTAAVPADVPAILTGARFTVVAGALVPVADPPAIAAGSRCALTRNEPGWRPRRWPARERTPGRGATVPAQPSRQQHQSPDIERTGATPPGTSVGRLVGETPTRRPPAARRRRRRPALRPRLAPARGRRRRLRRLAPDRRPPAGHPHQAGRLRKRRADGHRRLRRLGRPGPPDGPAAHQAPSRGTGPWHRHQNPRARPVRPAQTIRTFPGQMSTAEKRPRHAGTGTANQPRSP